MELYIVRHGETLWNREKRLQGREDIELSEKGREVARLTGEALMNTRIDKIFSSPLKRAYETACLIRNGRDIEIETDDRLRELSFGHFEGQNFSELIKDESLTFLQAAGIVCACRRRRDASAPDRTCRGFYAG